MIITVDKTVEETAEIIKDNIVTYKRNPALWKGSLFLKDEFIGECNVDGFWILKTRPRIINGVQKAFFGKLEATPDGKTKITGKYRYFRPHLILITALHIAITLLMLFTSELSIINRILLIALMNIVMELILLLNNLTFWCERKEVLDFLQNL